ASVGYFSAIRRAINSATFGNEVSRPLFFNDSGGNLARAERLGGPGGAGGDDGLGGIPIHQREIRVVLVLLVREQREDDGLALLDREPLARARECEADAGISRCNYAGKRVLSVLRCCLQL